MYDLNFTIGYKGLDAQNDESLKSVYLDEIMKSIICHYVISDHSLISNLRHDIFVHNIYVIFQCLLIVG